MTIENYSFFDKNNSLELKKTINDALKESNAVEKGIRRTGGNRTKKPSTKMALSVIFRKNENFGNGSRTMNVGQKELVMEISPGKKAPDFLKVRVVKGFAVKESAILTAIKAFLAIKNQGVFRESHQKAIKEMVLKIVENF